MQIWEMCVAARTKGAKYLEQLIMIKDDIIQTDIANRKRGNVGHQGTKSNTYFTINPNGTVHPMYLRKVASVSDRDRVCATRLRLSSHRLAIETGHWNRIPREKRLCACGAIQTEEHVI